MITLIVSTCMGGGEGGSWQNVDLQFFQPRVYILQQNLAKNLHLQNLLTKCNKIWINLQSTMISQ